MKPKLGEKGKECRLDEKIVESREVRQLLDKYKEVISNCTIDTLPPFREVSHCTSFILGSTLPNKPAYSLTLEQNKELARQVEEFLAKGFIRRSINPCALPTLLAPKKEGT